MPASLLIAAPDSTTRMRQAADLVVDPARADPAVEINALTAAKRLPADLADGSYATRSPLVHRTAAGFRGDGASVAIRPASGFVGEAAVVDEEGAHLGVLEGFRIECANRCAGIAFRAGGPYSGEPNTSPDSNHRVSGVDVFYPLGGVGMVSGPGTDGIRGDSIVGCLIVKGAIVWQGSDVWIDNVVCRDSPIPAEIGGGSSRVGTLKAYYAGGKTTPTLAVRITGTGTVCELVEAQDAGGDGLRIEAADVTVRHFTGDSCGRLGPGDGLVLAGPRAHVFARLRERGQTPTSPMRNGIRIETTAKGSVVDAMVSGAISGSAWVGRATDTAALRVNGVWWNGGPTGTPVDLTDILARLATLEAGAVNTATSLTAIDSSIANLGGQIDGVSAGASLRLDALDRSVSAAEVALSADGTRLDSLGEAIADQAAAHANLAARVTTLEQHDAAAAATLPTLDAAIAAIKANAPQMRIAMEQASKTLKAGYGA